MPRRAVLAAVCCASVIGVGAPSAGAAGASEADCTATVDWSISGTSASASYSNIFCYDADAAAALDGIFPEWSVSGSAETYPPGSTTFTYSPIVGNCLGQLSYNSGTTSATGLLKNDGNFHNVTEIVWTNTTPAIVISQTGAGVLQNACSPSFQQTHVTFKVYETQ